MSAKSVRFLEPPAVRLVNAIENCDVEKVRQLLKLSIDVNERTSSGITPMHWACGMGDDPLNIKIVDLLLSHKGNPNIKSSECVTPVHVAASWGFLNVLKALVAQGGDPWVEDQEGFNAWDLALQKNHWTILKYLTSYMEEEEEEEVDDPAEISVQCVFVKNREVDLASSASLSNTGGSCNNQGFLCSESLLGGSYNNLNMAICQSANTTNTSSASSVVVVEEHIYSDAEKGVDLVEWHYPPLIPQDSITDATLNEALCSSAEDVPDSYMDSQLLVEELKSLGQKPGPITATTKQIYLRQLYRLRKEQAANGQPSAPSPHRIGLSKELQTLVANYPGKENDVKIASNLDRLLVTHFNCPDPAKPWREGLSKKSFNYLLLDPRVTHNLPLNESQDQSRLFKRFVSSIFYIGKGKQTRPHEHLYEAVKLRNRPQGFVKISKKVRRILDIWDDGQGVISIHVFQNSLPVEAYCREAAMIEAIGLSSITNVKRGDYYGICTSWSGSDKRRWGSHLLFKAFHIFLHEGEREIRPVDL